MMIGLDFDGTCVTNDYPKVGSEIGAVPVLTELIQKGHRLILITNRTGKELEEAELWFKAYGIPLFGVNRNPIQYKFSKSPKIYANLYIDDTGLGCPLKTDKTISKKPFVDWEEARVLLSQKSLI